MLVREHLYKHFVEDSDPVHDMGIGKIMPHKIFQETVSPGISKWMRFIKDLEGKTVTGKMRPKPFGQHYVIDSTAAMLGATNFPDEPNIETIKVYRARWESSELPNSNIILTDEDGNEYIMYGGNEYTIK